MQIKELTKELLKLKYSNYQELYKDWCNNFIEIHAFATHHNINVPLATALINNARFMCETNYTGLTEDKFMQIEILGKLSGINSLVQDCKPDATTEIRDIMIQIRKLVNKAYCLQDDITNKYFPKED